RSSGFLYSENISTPNKVRANSCMGGNRLSRLPRSDQGKGHTDMGRGAESDGGNGGISRRAFLGRAGAAGAVAMVPGAMLVPSARAAHELAQLRTFTAAQAATLEAVLERLIPTDATGPGAKEANVLRYVDWALAGELGAYKDAYLSGLAALDAYSQASQGAPFAN